MDHRYPTQTRQLWFSGQLVECFEISTLPQRYDIVPCRFPYNVRKPRPSKVKPVVVVRRLITAAGIPTVIVTYSTHTSYDKPERRGLDLIIENPHDLKAMSLEKPTRFDLDPKSMAVIPWCKEYFTQQWSGRLTAPCIEFVRKRLEGQIATPR